jgi:membrane-associated phospholipid phosphatase
MPNAFPSLHFGTALVLVFFAPGKLWRTVALAFLASTGLATLSTGEHYFIDLVSGAAFGCFAASVGHRKVKSAILFLGVALLWSLAVRFESGFLILHPTLLQLLAALTLALAILAVFRAWSRPVESAASLPAAPGT